MKINIIKSKERRGNLTISSRIKRKPSKKRKNWTEKLNIWSLNSWMVISQEISAEFETWNLSYDRLKNKSQKIIFHCKQRIETIAAYLDRIQYFETQLQTSKERITDFEVLLGQKDETIDGYSKEITKMNRALDSDQKFSRIFSVIIYSITIWILNN